MTLFHSLPCFQHMPRFACQSGSTVAALGLGPLAAGIMAFGAATPLTHAGSCMYEVVATLQGPACAEEVGTPAAIPWAINDNNEVVGYYNICGVGSRRAFYWSQETGVVTLTFPFAIHESRAYDISDNGWIVGMVNLVGDPFGNIGFVMRPDGSGLQLIPPLPGGSIVDALAVNDAPKAVGYSNGLGEVHDAFLWSGALPVSLERTLGAEYSLAYRITSADVVCGFAGPSTLFDHHAFLWDGISVTDLGVMPGAITGAAKSVNNKGEAAIEGMISYSPPPVIYHGYFYSGGRLTQIIPPDPSLSVRVYDLNDSGVVVGKVVSPAPTFDFGFTWRNGEFTTLASSVIGVTVEHVGSAYGINNSGWIVVMAEFKGPIIGGVGAVLRPVATPGDLSGDGDVDGIDLAMLLAAWGSDDPQADLDGDGHVNGIDLALLLGLWTP